MVAPTSKYSNTKSARGSELWQGGGGDRRQRGTPEDRVPLSSCHRGGIEKDISIQTVTGWKQILGSLLQRPPAGSQREAGAGPRRGSSVGRRTEEGAGCQAPV